MISFRSRYRLVTLQPLRDSPSPTITHRYLTVQYHYITVTDRPLPFFTITDRSLPLPTVIHRYGKRFFVIYTIMRIW